MRFKSLTELKRPELREVALGSLPQSIVMDHYAHGKAFGIGELVLDVHGESLEWYGFTLGTVDRPDFIVDIGLPHNDLNLQVYAGLSAERIADFRETLPDGVIINGWIHSHGALMLKDFSHTDERNHEVVLDFVAASLKKPVAKREVAIKDLIFLVKGRFGEEDLARGSVCIITDAPVSEAVIMETVYGSFCHAIVVGDGGWHHQEIHTREHGVLSGHVRTSHREAEVVLVDTGRAWSPADMDMLREEVAGKIRPSRNPPVETVERM